MHRLSSAAVLGFVLALGACSGTEDGANGSATSEVDTTSAPTDGSAASGASTDGALTTNSVIAGSNDSVGLRVGEDGASVDTGDTEASVQTDGDVSATVKTEDR